MSLEQIIINLETIYTVIREIANSSTYINLSKEHNKLYSNLADVEHYLKDSLIRLEELSKEEKFLDLLDSYEAVPLSEDLYTRATELTKGMVVDLDEEFEGDFW